VDAARAITQYGGLCYRTAGSKKNQRLFWVNGWVARCLAQKGPFHILLRSFFDRSAATACKNPLRLAKNGHVFVSEATT
jgi:hypothetical protein